jgi:hypothetical protein
MLGALALHTLVQRTQLTTQCFWARRDYAPRLETFSQLLRASQLLLQRGLQRVVKLQRLVQAAHQHQPRWPQPQMQVKVREMR